MSAKRGRGARSAERDGAGLEDEGRMPESGSRVLPLRMNYIVLYVFQGGKAHSLVCGVRADRFAALKPDYEKVIASARVE